MIKLSLVMNSPVRRLGKKESVDSILYSPGIAIQLCIVMVYQKVHLYNKKYVKEYLIMIMEELR
jgi:hypothetical protein